MSIVRFQLVLCLIGIALSAAAEGSEDAELAAARAASGKAFKTQVAPFVQTYCGRCHVGNKMKGKVSFETALKNPDQPGFRLLWKRTTEQLEKHEMPPDDEDKQPTDAERKAILDWIAGMRRLSPKDPGFFVIRRLNRTEYGNTLHDLLGVDPKIALDLPEEVFGAGYTNSLSPLLMEQYLSAANEALDQCLAPAGSPPTATEKKLFGPEPSVGVSRKEEARKVAQKLARQAYRRPPSEGEIEVLLRVFTLASGQGKSYPEALRLMTKAVLVSPQFLFITPSPSDAFSESKSGGDIVALDDYQLASRLSYLLWQTMPDAELSALADAGKLREPSTLAAQARRLIADPKSRAFFDGFGAQWLGLDKLGGKTFDNSRFPQMAGSLRASMYDEARLLFESILRENRSLATFIDSDYTFLDKNLASIYGLEKTVTGSQMQRVKLANANRGGILTMPGILAMSSFPNRTSPVNRGVWVLEQVLGEHVPPPPADVPALDKQDAHKIAALTLRQRTEMHRANPVCANCHKVLDPIGFGLENFDAIGRWRDKDDTGGPIDATGELPGDKRFTTPRELKSIIAGRTGDFSRNLTGKLLAYALCRQLDGYDEIVVDKLSASVAQDGYRMQALVVGVVTSYPFTHRRLNNPGETSHGK